MDRIIEVKVGGNHLSKDSKNAGVRGEANVTKLRITFDEGWEGFTKKITFWNARGLNPVVIDLLPSLAESSLVYLVPIPAEPMEMAGELTFVIEGTVNDKVQRSLEDKLEVKDASIAPNAGQPVPPTENELTQLSGEIEKIKGDILEVRNVKEETIGLKNDTAMFAERALDSYHESYSEAERAKMFADDAQGNAERAEATLGKTSYIGDNGNWFAWDSHTSAFYDTGVKAQAGSTVYCGDNPPPEADVWIDPNGGADALADCANAFKGTASDTVVQLDDVSPVEHSTNVKITSKNLFNQAEISMYGATIDGLDISYLEDEDCFLINGTSTATRRFCYCGVNIPAELGATYSVTAVPISGEIIKLDGTYAVAYFGTSNDGKQHNNWNTAELKNDIATGSLSVPHKYISTFWFYITPGVTFTDYKVRVQLEKGSPTSFSHYIDDLSAVTVTKCGKSLFDLSEFDKIWGARYNGSGNIIDVSNFRGKTLRYQREVDFTNTIEDTATFAVKIHVYDENKNEVKQHFANSPVNKESTTMISSISYFVPEDIYYVGFGFQMFFNGTNAPQSGSTITVKNSMVELGGTMTEYEPYSAETFTPNADGTLEIPSQSPIMTLYSDTAGVNIECEYNKDSNKVIEKLTNAIISLGGNV